MSTNGNDGDDTLRKLAPPTLEGASALAKKLRELADRIEENPENRATSFSKQIVESRTVPEEFRSRASTFNYNTGRSEWHIKAIVVEPVPADKRIEGVTYA